MKNHFLFCCSFFFLASLPAQTTITEAEARAFTERYLDTLLYSESYPELDDFFLGEYDEEEAMNLSYFFLYHYKVKSVDPPWVTVLVSTEEPGYWDHQYRFLLAKEGGRLLFKPRVEREWLADAIYPYQDETVISIPFSAEEQARLRKKMFAALHIEDTSLIDRSHPALLGDWIVKECVNQRGLPYQHWSKENPRFTLQEGGRFDGKGEWFAWKDRLYIRHYSQGQFDVFGYEFLTDGSLWLSLEDTYGENVYFHLVRASREVAGPSVLLAPCLVPGAEIFLQPQYDELDCFDYGLARFKHNGKTGFLGRDGQVVIPARYDKATSFNESGLAFCNQDGGSVLIDTLGNVVNRFDHEVEFQWLTGDYFIRKADKKGLADSLGNYVLPPVYDEIRPGSFTHYQVAKDGKWGILDMEGNVVLPIEYEGLEQRTEKLAIIKKGMKYGVIDIETGALIIPVAFRRIRIKGGPLILGFTEDKVIPHRLDGSRLRGLEYDLIVWMGWNYFGVEEDGKRGIINEQGETVLPLKYDDLMWHDLSLKGIFETTLDGETAVRDTTGRIIPPEELEQLKQFAEAVEQIRRSTQEGEPLPKLHPQYNGGYYGYFSPDGKMVIPPIYDYARDFENGLAIVEKEGQYGMIDESGATALPFIFGHLYRCRDSGLLHVEYRGKQGFLRLLER